MGVQRKLCRLPGAIAISVLMLDAVVAGEACLSGGTTYAVSRAGASSAPAGLHACDIDGDGRLDLISANDFNDTISVLLAAGDGTFDAFVGMPVGADPDLAAEPVDVACCDLNGDGLMDVVVANHGTDDVAVLIQQDTTEEGPAFDPAVYYAVGEAPWAVACVDVNDDTLPDVITANFTTNDISVRLNVGDGLLGAEDAYATGANPRAMSVCDIDADVAPDVVTAEMGDNRLSVLANDGKGAFAVATTIPLGAAPFDVACCRLDSAGGPDLVAANIVDDSVSVALSSETAGIFGAATHYGGVDGPFGLACADIDDDGGVDVVTANLTGDDAGLFYGDGAGGLGSPDLLPVGDTPSAIVADRLTGGTAPDLAVAFASGILVVPNICGVTDYDGDGDVDLLDFGGFQRCIGNAATGSCGPLDLSADGTIDLQDFVRLEEFYTGPN